MTQKEIVNFCEGILNNDQIHPETIKYAIERVYEQNIGVLLKKNFRYWTKRYTGQTVTLDATENRYYTTLPASIVQIPNVTNGVLSVNIQQGTDMNFYQTTEENIEYLNGSIGDNINEKIGYFVQRDKIWYHNITAIQAAAGVKLILAINFSDFAATDEVPLPSGIDLIQMAINFILQRPEDDRKNDNV